MNKTELIDAIAEKTELTKHESKKALEATTNTITNALSDGEKVQITNFGNWETVTRKAREGRNPQTGKKIHIPEKKAVKFKPSKTLIEKLNEEE